MRDSAPKTRARSRRSVEDPAHQSAGWMRHARVACPVRVLRL